VKELWTYQLLLTPVPKKEVEEEISLSPKVKTKAVSSQFIYNGNEDKAGSGSDREDEDKGDESDSGKSDKSDKSDRTDADLIAQLSEDSDDDDPAEEREGVAPTPRRRRKLKVSDTLVCLILGLWLLRIPFTHVDIES
jgi:hypothetical protein